MSTDDPATSDADLPEWDDEYVDRVADRLQFNYDLEKDRTVHGRTFTLYGEMLVHSEKHFFHPALSFGYHESREHLFVTQSGRVDVPELETLVEFGHDLAEDWVDANEEHYSTDFTFVVLADEISDSVETFVTTFRDRTLLKYGYHGHYEINVVVVAPDEKTVIASPEADVEQAFDVWTRIEQPEVGLLGLIARRFQL